MFYYTVIVWPLGQCTECVFVIFVNDIVRILKVFSLTVVLVKKQWIISSHKKIKKNK